MTTEEIIILIPLVTLFICYIYCLFYIKHQKEGNTELKKEITELRLVLKEAKSALCASKEKNIQVYKMVIECTEMCKGYQLMIDGYRAMLGEAHDDVVFLNSLMESERDAKK